MKIDKENHFQRILTKDKAQKFRQTIFILNINIFSEVLKKAYYIFELFSNFEESLLHI
jgi:hypothetical protein